MANCACPACISLGVERACSMSRLVNHAADTHAQVVASKFEYVVTCQIYGKLSSAKPGSADRWKGDGIDQLRRQFSRNLRVGYVDTQKKKEEEEEEEEEEFFSCLLGIDPISDADRMLFKVK